MNAQEPKRIGEKRHNCDILIRQSRWAMSGYRVTGDRWTCSCGKIYQHLCDEAEGCWVEMADAPAPAQTAP